MISTSEYRNLSGKTVVGPDGDKIGKISDVYEAVDGSGLTFATVNTGLFGTGSSFFPLDRADLRGDEVVVPFTKDVVKDAPRVENDEELTAPEEQRLYEYYSGLGYLEMKDTATTEARGTVGHDTSGPETDTAMTRSEERLAVGTEKVETGRARLRKYVTTEHETRTVPVKHEEVTLEREPITDGNVGKAMDGPAISEEEHEVVLHDEKPVVAKEAVPVERVRLGKETQTDEVTVSEDVRKENIELEDGTYPTESGTRGGVGADRR